MVHELTDRYDGLRREWIAEYAGIWTIQKRRAERLNRHIRKRIRMTAGARPNPHDDNVIHPLWARHGATAEVWLERLIVLLCAVLAPIGWPLGYRLYNQLVTLIPDRLRAYPIPALLWTATGIGTLTTLLYAPDKSLTTTLAAPYLIAQIPAVFAVAGIYGILNGWLAVDGSATCWPLSPPPMPVDFNLTLEPDDLTAPAMFWTADPESAVDLTPATQITQSTQSAKLVFTGLAACAIGSIWMLGAVTVGLKNAVTQPFTVPNATLTKSTSAVPLVINASAAGNRYDAVTQQERIGDDRSTLRHAADSDRHPRIRPAVW